jgi:hypothetical protein
LAGEGEIVQPSKVKSNNMKVQGTYDLEKRESSAWATVVRVEEEQQESGESASVGEVVVEK